MFASLHVLQARIGQYDYSGCSAVDMGKRVCLAWLPERHLENKLPLHRSRPNKQYGSAISKIQ